MYSFDAQRACCNALFKGTVMCKRNQLSVLLLGAILSLSVLSTASAQGGRGNGYHSVDGSSTTKGYIDGQGESHPQGRSEDAAKGYDEGKAKSHANGHDERSGGLGTGGSHDE